MKKETENSSTVIKDYCPETNETKMDEKDTMLVERIAEAVVQKIDERDKLNLVSRCFVWVYDRRVSLH